MVINESTIRMMQLQSEADDSEVKRLKWTFCTMLDALRVYDFLSDTFEPAMLDLVDMVQTMKG